MNSIKLDMYLQQMVKILTKAYHDNRYYILRAYSVDWQERKTFDSCPTYRRQVRQDFKDALYFTTVHSHQEYATNVLKVRLTDEDKSMIQSTGKQERVCNIFFQ